MNGKQAKFLRRYCREMRLDYQSLKNVWSRIPAPSRSYMTGEMKRLLNEHHAIAN
jgi:hypothetical protein